MSADRCTTSAVAFHGAGYSKGMVAASGGLAELAGVVAFGASAGGVEALSRVASGLSDDLAFAYVMALHIPAGSPSILARIIDRSGPLPADAATHGARLQPGRIYVATPGHHLLVADHRVVLSRGPTENGHRPGINALFRSVALDFGPRAIGVLLSGVLDDGVLGLAAIRSRGGITIGQSPNDAVFPSLPVNARRAGVLDRESTADQIGELLRQLAQRRIEETPVEPDPAIEFENRIAMTAPFAADFDTQDLGPPSGLADDFGHGPLFQRYTEVAHESEFALTVLSDRLSATGRGAEHAGD